jgi:Zn-dependent metalloprotease
MSGYVTTTQDNGGVHINSGIPNRAFYLAAHALGGHTATVVGRVWVPDVDPGPQGQHHLPAVRRRDDGPAVRLYGARSEAANVIAEAWKEVGLSPIAQ